MTSVTNGITVSKTCDTANYQIAVNNQLNGNGGTFKNDIYNSLIGAVASYPDWMPYTFC